MKAALAKPQRKTKRLEEISSRAKKVKQFQRTDYGGKDPIEHALDLIDKEILDEGVKLSKDAKILIAKLLISHAKKQVHGCRKRTLKSLNEIIDMCGG